MILIFGQASFGRCDYVPGRMHVATHFLAFFYMPILPLHGLIVVEEPNKLTRTEQMPVSLRSLLLAWLRLGLALGCVLLTGIGAIQTLNYFFGKQPVPLGQASLTLLAGIVVAGCACYAAALRPRASFTRALQLALAANVNPAEIATIYKQPLPDETTLQGLLKELRPVDETGKADFGLAGRIGSLLFCLVAGGLLLLWSGEKLLRHGHRGYGESFLWAIPLALGLGIVEGGVVSLMRLSNRTRDLLFWPTVALFLVAGFGGPSISKSYLDPEVMKWYK